MSYTDKVLRNFGRERLLSAVETRKYFMFELEIELGLEGKDGI